MAASFEIEKAGDINENGGYVRRTTATNGVAGADGFQPARLSPAARLFHAPKFNCCILAIMGCKTSIDPDVVKAGLRETLLRHPRFSSKMVPFYCSVQFTVRFSQKIHSFSFHRNEEDQSFSVLQ